MDTNRTNNTWQQYLGNKPASILMMGLGFCLVMLLQLATIDFAQAQSRKAKPAAESATVAPIPLPVISWEAKTFDFGQLKQGEKTTTTYSFTNTGDAPLVISNVQTTCGCTATDWSRKPIAPQETGKITVTFNSAGKMGRQNKIITVISNAEKIEDQLTLSGVVLPADTKTETAK